jgi:hypothetical protein
MFHDSGYETVKSESVFFSSMSVNAEQEKWFFSIIDIVAVLTESIEATAYWRKLKQRLGAPNSRTSSLKKLNV